MLVLQPMGTPVHPASKHGRSETTRLAVADAPAWARALQHQPADGRNAVLVVADEATQQRICDTARASGREVVATATPFDAMQIPTGSRCWRAPRRW